MRSMNQPTAPEAPGFEPPSSEAHLVAALRAYLVGEGFEAIAEEVRSHGRARTDLIVWDGLTLVGIEAKLRDWGRVVSQAVLNRVCYDQSYLAMWADSISGAMLQEAKAYGIGVLAVDPVGVSVIMLPSEQSPIPALRRRVIEAAGWEGK
jgi:hypothetical protein